jgi:DNA-binding CsgD family transcriptional regulator
VPQVVSSLGQPRRSADHRAQSSGVQAQAREMAALWTQGDWTLQELADRYNCTPNQVYYRVRRYGAEGRVQAPRGWGRRPGRNRAGPDLQAGHGVDPEGR